MQQKASIIGILTLASVAIIFFLKYTSPESINKKNNGFTRSFVDIQAKTFELPFDAGKLLAIENGVYYFLSPNRKDIVVSNKEFTKYSVKVFTELEKISTNSILSHAFDKNNLTYFLINPCRIAEASLNTFSFKLFYPPSHFTRAAKATPNTYLVRETDSTKENDIFKLIDSSKIISEYSEITEKARDGGLSTDGFLVKDEENSSFYYIYYFKNKILEINESYGLENTINTIDTNTICKNKIVSSTNASTNKKTFFFSGSLSVVNTHAVINSKYIIVHSKLRADNQKYKQFYNSSTLDFYNRKTRVYSGSIVISNKNGESFKSLYATDDSLYFLISNSLSIYTIPKLLQ